MSPASQLKMVARFVTTDAFELKLGIDVLLGASHSETELQSDLIPGLATRGICENTKSALSAFIMVTAA